MGWLYVPESAGLNSASTLPATTTAPSVTWRGKPMLPQSWLRAWQKESWLRPLSGTTCSPSTADAGVDAWISSLPVSPASRGPSPANERAPRTSVGSGRASNPSFTTWDRDSCSWRMSQGYLLEEWDMFLEDWPIAGSMRNGSCSERMMSALPIAGNGCSSWPTADTNSSTYSNGERGMNLREAASKWPTATVHEAGTLNQSKTGGPPQNLAVEARKWPTANAHDGRRPGHEQGSTQGANLKRDAESWPTPRQEMDSGRHRGQPDTLHSASKQWQTPAREQFTHRRQVG